MSDTRKPAPKEVPRDKDTDAAVRYHSVDDRLRSAGFTIHSRPARGPVRWQRLGDVFDEQDALRIASDAAKLLREESRG